MQTETMSFLEAIQRKSFEISLIRYFDDGIFFVYAPALEVVGYGKSEEDAEHSFNIVLDEFLTYTKAHNTLETNLLELGWTYNEMDGDIKSPVESHLINIVPTYKEIIDSKEHTTQRIKINFY